MTTAVCAAKHKISDMNSAVPDSLTTHRCISSVLDLIFTTLLVWFSECLVLVAYELGNLWVSVFMLVLLFPYSNKVLDLMDCIM